MLRYTKKRGFTLVELLVVLSIISLLSSIVLASLSIARRRGSDAAIKTDLSMVRAGAEILQNTLGGYSASVSDDIAYTTTCQTITPLVTPTNILNDVSVQEIINDAYAENNTVGVKCVAKQNFFVIAVKFKTTIVSGQDAWCIDSTGISRGITFSRFGATDTNCAQANQ